MITYTYGSYDILRAKDLEELDKQIQVSRQEGSSSFGLGIFDENLCQVLGLNTPIKSLEDRMKIMQQIRGIDFVFPVQTLDKKILEDQAKKAYMSYLEVLKKRKSKVSKEFSLGYAPGTYDLFHAGHLENLMIAARKK